MEASGDWQFLHRLLKTMVFQFYGFEAGSINNNNGVVALPFWDLLPV